MMEQQTEDIQDGGGGTKVRGFVMFEQALDAVNVRSASLSRKRFLLLAA